MLGSNADVGSGEAGLKLGVIVHNQLNPEKPLPMTGGNVVPDTVRNVGAGQTIGDAFMNASEANSGLSAQGQK